MDIANKYPTIYPSLNLDFANSKTIDPRITFSRASSATYFDEKGVMRTAPDGVPRIDHDPVTGECKGLSIEEQRTNLLTYSEQFDNAAWIKYNTTLSANAITAPDGTITADKLVENTLNGEHYIDQEVSVTSGVTYTLSFFAKWDGPGRLFNVRTALQGKAAVAFNLSTGAGIVTSGTDLVSYGSVSVGNGWYRCWIVYTAAGTGIAVFRGQLYTNNTIYTGDGTSGIYIWGAQLEVGAFPTSYIKTEASQVTRAADSASMTGTNFSDWYKEPCTLYLEWSVEHLVLGNRGPIWINNGVNTRGIGVYYVSQNSIGLAYRAASGASYGTSNYGGITYQNSTKVSWAFDDNAMSRSVNGTPCVEAVDTDNLVDSFPADRVQLGYYAASGSNTGYLNCHIKRFAYYPRRLTNEQLQALTT